MQGKEYCTQPKIGYFLHHSFLYKRKGLSNSYKAFLNGDRLAYGEVLVNVFDDGKCFGGINCYHLKGNTLYGENEWGFLVPCMLIFEKVTNLK